MSTEEFFAAIKKNATDRVKAMLDRDPSLAAANDEYRSSALQVAVTYGCNLRSQKTRPTVDVILQHMDGLSLGDAAMLGDVERLHVLFADGADPDARDARGWTALHWAAEVGQEETARLLLNSGANVDSPSGDGTPLERASHPGPNKPAACQPIIDLLIEHGAVVDPHHAALIGDFDRLLRHIQDRPECVNNGDARGATPLFHAAHNLHLKCVELLLAKGADVNMKTDDGQTPISSAVDHMWDRGGFEVVQRLALENPDMDFFTAAQANNPDVVRAELAADPSLATVEKWGHTALYLAAGADAADIIPVLIRHGAETEWKREHDGHNPLNNAVWHGKIGAVRALLEGGANSNTKDHFQNTPLHNAVLRDQLEIAELLVGHGANLAARNEKGHTPREMAEALGRTPLLGLFPASSSEATEG